MDSEWDWRQAVQALRAEIPDIHVEHMDFGNTVAAQNPTTGRVIYVKRVYRPERDGAVGYWLMSPCSVSEAVEILRQSKQPRGEA